MASPTPEEKRRAVLVFASMMIVGLVITGLVTAGVSALLTLGWNLLAGSLDLPPVSFWIAWAGCVALGFVVAGIRIAMHERASPR